MDCEQAQLLITLAVYGELPDDQRPALELHLAACARCRSEFESVKALEETMSLVPAAEPSANLVTRSRIALDEALDVMPRENWLLRAWGLVWAGTRTMSRAPVAASMLLVLGLLLGGFSGYRAARQANAASVASAQPGAGLPSALQPVNPSAEQPIQVANISSITSQPGSQNVEVRFDRVVPETMTGSLSDPEIRQMLLLSAQSGLDPAVQQASIALLANECQQRIQCPDGPARRALLVALRYGKSAVVRLKALDGLEPYVAQDVRVRDAVLESLMKDPDPMLRSRALQVLEPVQVDTTVREVLQTVASDDNNSHIRTVSREVLEQMPPVQ